MSKDKSELLEKRIEAYVALYAKGFEGKTVAARAAAFRTMIQDDQETYHMGMFDRWMEGTRPEPTTASERKAVETAAPVEKVAEPEPATEPKKEKKKKASASGKIRQDPAADPATEKTDTDKLSLLLPKAAYEVMKKNLVLFFEEKSTVAYKSRGRGEQVSIECTIPAAWELEGAASEFSVDKSLSPQVRLACNVALSRIREAL